MTDEKNTKDSLTQAIHRAEALRCTNNGLGGVYLYLGHDGDNGCTLRDTDAKVVGEGTSGRSLWEAVDRAEHDWRYRRLQEHPFQFRELCREAVAAFTGIRGFTPPDSGMFNTANFQAVLKARDLTPTPDQATALLKHSKPAAMVVPLKGGAHWFLLPEGISREVAHD